MNYIGNKYRILNKIKRYFPQNINVLVDLFCGGCDITINIHAREKYANDINYHVIDIFKFMQNHPPEYILEYIDSTIQKWGLSKENEDAYDKFRQFYNKTQKPIDLFILMCFSFNYQFRFNSKHEYNNPFGKSRSSFNERMRANLRLMLPKIKNVKFSAEEFQNFDVDFLKKDDFLYADPPYLITTGSYNDGKRGFTGWGTTQELKLYNLLDYVNSHDVKFALSNVSEHKGRKNTSLLAWINRRGYYIHKINFDYNNSNYQAKNTDKKTQEVLITNYETNPGLLGW